MYLRRDTDLRCRRLQLSRQAEVEWAVAGFGAEAGSAAAGWVVAAAAPGSISLSRRPAGSHRRA